MEPFNYRAMLPDPSQELLKSIEAGAQLVGGAKSPEEKALMKERILTEQQQRRQSEAAIQSSQAATAASSFGLSQERIAAQRKDDIFAKLSAYAGNPNATLTDVSSVLPFLSEDQRNAVASTAEIRVNGRISDARKNGEVLSPQQLQDYSNELTLLPTQKRLEAQARLMTLPEGIQSSMKATVMSALNAAVSGNPDVSAKIAENFAEAAKNSPDERVKQASSSFLNFAKSVRENNADPQDIAFMAMNLANLTEDSGFAKALLESYGSYAKNKKSVAEKPLSVSMENQLASTNKAVEVSDKIALDVQGMLDRINNVFSSSGVDEKGNPKTPSGNIFKKGLSEFSIKSGYGINDFDRIRQEYIKLQQSEGLKEWKKNASGSFSNTETKLALGNMPDLATDPKGAIAWLNAVLNTSKRLSVFNQIQSDWVSEFRTNGAASRDAVISGIKVEKGTPNIEFTRRARKLIEGLDDPYILLRNSQNPSQPSAQPSAQPNAQPSQGQGVSGSATYNWRKK